MMMVVVVVVVMVVRRIMRLVAATGVSLKRWMMVVHLAQTGTTAMAVAMVA
jgi:hypothetical protein